MQMELESTAVSSECFSKGLGLCAYITIWRLDQFLNIWAGYTTHIQVLFQSVISGANLMGPTIFNRIYFEIAWVYVKIYDKPTDSTSLNVGQFQIRSESLLSSVNCSYSKGFD